LGSESGTGRVVWEAGTPGMGNGLILARIAGQGLKEVRNDWTGIYDHTHTHTHTRPS